MSDLPEIRVSGEAARFASMLRDFGHLDEVAYTDLMLELAAHGPPEGTVDLPMMREVAARFLFGREALHLRDGKGIVSEDWPLLFS